MMNIKKLTCVLLSCAITFSNVSVVKATENDNAEPVVSDVEEVGDDVVIEDVDKPYLALGENLTKEQRRKVLDLMGIEEENLADYDVVYVNNKEEHTEFDKKFCMLFLFVKKSVILNKVR